MSTTGMVGKAGETELVKHKGDHGCRLASWPQARCSSWSLSVGACSCAANGRVCSASPIGALPLTQRLPSLGGSQFGGESLSIEGALLSRRGRSVRRGNTMPNPTLVDMPQTHHLLGVATTARIGRHPIHPMLIPFPIALLVSVFLSDMMFWSTGSAFWAEASFWLLGFALFMSAAAALAGFADFLGNAAVRSISAAWHHMIGNVTAVVLALASFLLRRSAGAAEGVLPWGLALSTIIVLLLLYTGWKGGTLVYEHRVGVQPEEDEDVTSRPKLSRKG